MSQLALPLETATGAVRIILGPSNQSVVDAFAAAAQWPFRTAVLTGPPRSGKSLLARYFAAGGLGDAVDEADTMAEVDLFHRWNLAQQQRRSLLIVSGRAPGEWPIALPDLASRLGAALLLRIAGADDAMVAALAEEHATRRGLVLGEGAMAWLLARVERSHAAVERAIASADRLSLERAQPVTISLLRDVLDEGGGSWQPRLL